VESSRFALAVHEGRRALDQQSNDLLSIRNRVNNLVAVGGLAAAFIGGLAIRDDNADMTGWAWAGLTFFVALVAVAVLVQLPRSVVFTQRADHLVRWAKTPGMTQERMDRNLAIHMRNQYVANRLILSQTTGLLVSALILLLLEVGALLLDLRGR
jgi:hypothetical protein